MKVLFEHQSDREPTVQRMQRGWLRRIEEDGTLVVLGDQNGAREYCCDMLMPGGQQRHELSPGERVLFVPTDEPDKRGCVLGVVGKYRPVAGPDNSAQQVLQLAADDKISLTCGKASITLLADGTIVIRGARLLSRASGLNRIKGAAVQIN